MEEMFTEDEKLLFKEDEKLLLISSIMKLQTQIENKTTELNKLTEELAALNDSLKLDKEPENVEDNIYSILIESLENL